MQLHNNSLHRKINRLMGKAIGDFEMIQDGDRLMVAVSGGKDSLCMLHFLRLFQKKAPVNFDILAVNLDQKQPGFPAHVLPELFEQWEVPYKIIEQDTYSIVKKKTPAGKTYCSLCSRMRRGILYDKARHYQCNKIALGHHQDDVIETFLLNTFFSGQISTMLPNYVIEAGDLQVIRPLYNVPEETISQYSIAQDWPIVPCSLCGSQENMKRQEMKTLFSELNRKYPKLRETTFGALHNVDPMLMPDQRLWKSTVPEL